MRTRIQDHLDGIPTLPTLDSGLVLLETTDNEQAIGPLGSLVLDHLFCSDDRAVWVDSGGHATTQRLARMAPSLGLLERIRVARAFTAYQHYSLVEELDQQLVSPAARTALVVVPWLDALYRDGDLPTVLAGRMIEHVTERLARLARRANLPVLVTRRQADELTAAIADRATHTIEYQQTAFGPRFVGEAFETLVYEGNGYVQTTLAFWRRVLERRYDVRDALRVTAEGVA